MRAKVVIVGGGVMGAAIAWQAGKRFDPIHEPVVLLERKSLASGSSGRSGAILRQFYSDRVLAAMARDSLRTYAMIQRRTGRLIGFQRMGVLTLAHPDRFADVEMLERNVAMMSEIGIDVRRLEAAEIRKLVQGIEVRDGTIGAYEPDGAGLDPVRTVETLATLARERGVTTRQGLACEEILVENGRVVGVRTAERTIACEHVVVAAGPWTRTLFARLGIELPLTCIRPEQAFFGAPEMRVSAAAERRKLEEKLHTTGGSEMAEDTLAHIAEPDIEMALAAHPILLDLEQDIYVRTEGHASRSRVGRMTFAGDAEVPDPDALDERVSPRFAQEARAQLVARMPVYADLPDLGAEVGIYTMTPDCQALLGPVGDIAGLLVASGFSGHGFKLAPAVGEGVAQWLAGVPVSAFDPEFFAPGRFSGATATTARGFGL